ncbi:acyl-CoA thioesterase 2-like [Watersipora subatra]|uniref:acyl-CoA thioesterase 2-like n=1 Tax=Watersipora subatra TaxID=2589382 RepID=UPI00355BC3D0
MSAVTSAVTSAPPKKHNEDNDQIDNNDFANSFLNLQELDMDLYLSQKTWKAPFARGTYGGLTVCHCLYAASETVPACFILHSMHSYFLRPGDPTNSTIYRVQRTRDGQSFCSRTVFAIQNGKPILTLQASFHKEQTETSTGLEYQPVMPVVPHHSGLLNMREYAISISNNHSFSEYTRQLINQWVSARGPNLKGEPVRKPVDPEKHFRIVPNSDYTLLTWFKVPGNLGDDQNIHRCAAAYVSDYSLLYAAIPSTGQNFQPTMTASLDHSIWFHRSMKADEWMLFEAVGTQMLNSRVLCHGRIWTGDGKLAATVKQEGLVRGKL